MWELYDELIENIPGDITVDDITIGLSWTAVTAGDYCGAAMTVKEQGRSPDLVDVKRGKSLRDLAVLVKSWDFMAASVGAAAVNAYYNNRETWKRFTDFGSTPWEIIGGENAFDSYAHAVKGKKVGVIGHFRYLENYLTEASSVSVLERRPTEGDLPDSACEYILPEQEVVFITGSALVNKTLPRLLALSRDAHVILVGPSTPMTPILFQHGADELSGFLAGNRSSLVDAVSIASHRAFFQSGEQMRMIKKKSHG